MNCSIISAHRFNYIDQHFSRLHKHPCFEINIYLDGSGDTVINDHKYLFSQNCFSIIPPGVQHNETFTTSGTVICLRFECTNPYFVMEEFFSSYPQDSALGFYAERIFKEMTEKQTSYTYISNQLIKVCINEIQRIMEQKTVSFCDSLLDAKRSIDENFFSKIKFDELASRTGYSYDYFRHAFKNEFGMSPQNYLIKVRLENAHEILSSTHGISITEVAETCGFSDTSQFSTMFTKHYGISPKKFHLSINFEDEK